MCNFPDQNKSWVIIFLVYADYASPNNSGGVVNYNFLSNLEKLCRDLLNSELNASKIRIYPVFTTVTYKISDGVRHSAHGQTFIYKLHNSETTEKEIKLLRRVKRSNQKTEDLACIFSIIKGDWADEMTVEPQIFLNTWDHGAAFGIFPTQNTQNNPITRVFDWSEVLDSAEFPFIKKFLTKGINHGLIRKRKSRTIKSFSIRHIVFSFNKSFDTLLNPKPRSLDDILEMKPNKSQSAFSQKIRNLSIIDGVDIENEILTNEELAAAIEGTFQEGVSLLLMMNCCMSNIDALTWYKKSVEILIAPQSLIDYEDYNYPRLFNFLSKEITCDASTLSTVCLLDIKARAKDSMSLSKSVIFGFRLKNKNLNGEYFIDKLTTRLTEFFEILLKKLKDPNSKSSMKNLIRYSASFCYNFDEGVSLFQIDILHLVHNLRYSDNFDILQDHIYRQFLLDVKGILQRLTIEDFHIGENWHSENYGAVTRNQPSGISVYFPCAKLTTKEESLIDTYFGSVNNNKNSNGFYRGNSILEQILRTITEVENS